MKRLVPFCFAALVLALCAITSFAQNQNTPNTTPKPSPTPKATLPKDAGLPAAKAITDNQRTVLRREDASEEDSGVVPYINNFFSTTRLGPEDVIAVDVFDKPNYSNYYNLVVDKIRTGGFIIADNVLWSGKVLDPGDDENAQALHEFNEKVQADERVSNVLLWIRDGLMVIRK